MRLVLSEESADHSFVYQYRLGSDRQYKHKLSAGIFLAVRRGGSDTLSVIRKSSELVLVIKTSCSRNTSTDDRRKSVNAAEIGTKSNADKRLLCWIGEFKVFLLSYCPPALNLRKIPVIKAAKRDKNNQ